MLYLRATRIDINTTVASPRPVCFACRSFSVQARQEVFPEGRYHAILHAAVNFINRFRCVSLLHGSRCVHLSRPVSVPTRAKGLVLEQTYLCLDAALEEVNTPLFVYCKLCVYCERRISRRDVAIPGS